MKLKGLVYKFVCNIYKGATVKHILLKNNCHMEFASVMIGQSRMMDPMFIF